MKDICMFMTVKSSIKVALYFLKIGKTLRSEEIGQKTSAPDRSQNPLPKPVSYGGYEHVFSKTGCCEQSHSPLKLSSLTPVACASGRPGNEGGGRKALRMLAAQNPPLGRRQWRLPPPSETLRTAGCGVQPRAWRPGRPSACITPPGPRACLHPAGVRGRRHLEPPVLGPGEGAFGHRKIRRARGVDRRLQTLGGGGGGGIRGGLRFQTRGRSESAPGPRPKG